MAAHFKARPRKLHELRPDVDRDLAVLLEHCLAKEPSQRPNAAYLERVFSAPEGANGELTPNSFVGRLLERRVPQWVGAHLVGGLAVVELIELLTGIGVGGVNVVEFALISYFAGIPIVSVLAWYHGKAGRQRFERLEYWMLGSVALAWLALLVALIVL